MAQVSIFKFKLFNKLMNSKFYKLMLVTNRNNVPLEQYLKFIKLCAASGITSLQLREKSSSYEFLLEFGAKLKEVLMPYNIPLIINDSIDLARELDAEGVHLGQSDGNPEDARNILGPRKMIGVSINTFADLESANSWPIDYFGVGAIFPTASKTNIATIWGVRALSELSKLSKHPIIAIGGINEFNAGDVMLAGAQGIAAIGVFHDSEHPELVIRNIRKIVG